MTGLLGGGMSLVKNVTSLASLTPAPIIFSRRVLGAAQTMGPLVAAKTKGKM